MPFITMMHYVLIQYNNKYFAQKLEKIIFKNNLLGLDYFYFNDEYIYIYIFLDTENTAFEARDLENDFPRITTRRPSISTPHGS